MAEVTRASLAPGLSITCTASDTITQADLDTGSGTNDSGVKSEPSHLWKLDAREPL